MGTLGQRFTYGFVLAIIATAILVIGFLLKPEKPAEQKPASELTSIQTEVVRLRDIAQRNTLRGIGSRFASVANDSTQFLVSQSLSRQTGVVLDQTLVLLPPKSAVPAQFPIEAEGQRATANPMVWGPEVGFIVGRTSQVRFFPPPAIESEESLESGSWLVAVKRDSSGQVQFSTGTISGAGSEPCGPPSLRSLITDISLDDEQLGAGVFDLDGRFVGAVVRCEHGPAVVSVYAIRSFVDNARDPSFLVPLRLGVHFAEINPEWKNVPMPQAGILLADLWDESPLLQSGLLPGDVIVRANNQPVQRVGDLIEVLKNSADVQIEFSRAGRTRRTLLRQVAPQGGLAFRRPNEGIELSEVSAESSLGKAGFQVGDRILGVNGVSRPETIRRKLSQPLQQPLLVTAARGSRQLARVVMP